MLQIGKSHFVAEKSAKNLQQNGFCRFIADMKKSNRPFLGREQELASLRDLQSLRVAGLVVLKGRRRIGKSRLAEEFGRGLTTLTFVGLAPEHAVTAQEQREHFAGQLAIQLHLDRIEADDWDRLLHTLAHHTASGPVLIVLDEINWMGSKDRTFLPKLKTAWDAYFSKNPALMLILSGSMAGWIEKNILSSTGFFGRIMLDMTLEELPLNQCAKFWGPRGETISAYEKFQFLSVTGGVPRYLELINPSQTAEENIHRHCFRRDGILFNEFDRVFSDLFTRKSAIYKQIIQSLAKGSATAEQIYRKLDYSPSGTITEYLEDLVQTRYLDRDYTWDIKTKKRSKLSRYRLIDNYLRFYLRYIEPNRDTIMRTGGITPPAWHSIMGLQFENLVRKNLVDLLKLLKVDSGDVRYIQPFFQTATKKRKGCQVDLMIQTKFNTLYLCEIKFSQGEIKMDVVDEVKEKTKNLILPRGFSIRPVLIHVNGVAEAVEYTEFFHYIIDFGQLLE